jgi:hypothetical protein
MPAYEAAPSYRRKGPTELYQPRVHKAPFGMFSFPICFCFVQDSVPFGNCLGFMHGAVPSWICLGFMHGAVPFGMCLGFSHLPFAICLDFVQVLTLTGSVWHEYV